MPEKTLSEKLKALYLLQDTLPKLIEDESIPVQKMDDYYVKLEMLVGDKSRGERRPIELANLFASANDQEKADKVLVIGRAYAFSKTA